MGHVPIMVDEVLHFLKISDTGFYVDCTFGSGGHSEAILNCNNRCRVLGIDRDQSTSIFAKRLSEKYGDRFVYRNSLFSDIDQVFQSLDIDQIDGVLYDIGVSSMQLDCADRGFSFNKESILDMRMGINSISAYDIVNKYPERELADVIFKYGDERRSRSIARRIINYRESKPIKTTTELASIVEEVIGKHSGKMHPATRTFQAIRIAVNNELLEFEQSIGKVVNFLKPGGVMCVITFHSLEDRIAKNIFNTFSGKDSRIGSNRHIMTRDYDMKNDVVKYEKIVNLLTKKPLTPRAIEIESNIRSRSAKLRAVERV